MVWSNKVVWSEGMFLRPQHLQQQDRHTDSLVRAALRGLSSHGLGLHPAQIEHEPADDRQAGDRRGRGHPAGRHPVPDPGRRRSSGAAAVRSRKPRGAAYLALPELQPGAVAFDAEGSPDRGARFRGRVVEVRDSVSGGSELAPDRGRAADLSPAEGAGRAWRLRRGRGGARQGRAARRRADPGPRLRTALSHDRRPADLRELAERDRRQAGERGREPDRLCDESHGARRGGSAGHPGARAGQPGAAGGAPLRGAATQHPEALYQALLALAGAMATYGASERRPPAFPPYRHDDPASSFLPLMRHPAAAAGRARAAGAPGGGDPGAPQPLGHLGRPGGQSEAVRRGAPSCSRSSSPCPPKAPAS